MFRYVKMLNMVIRQSSVLNLRKGEDMFILWGFGKTTRKVIGGFGSRTCNYCNTNSIWQLCIVRTWFTIFFIPFIPYATKYCISCPNCQSYVELSKEEFEKYKNQMQSEKGKDLMNDEIKYRGKNEAQINYLKHMEEINKTK